MLVAGAFHTLPRVLGMYLLIRNLFWMVQVPQLGVQHRSRRKSLLRESQGKSGMTLKMARREDGTEEVMWMTDILSQSLPGCEVMSTCSEILDSVCGFW